MLSLQVYVRSYIVAHVYLRLSLIMALIYVVLSVASFMSGIAVR